MPGLRKKGGGYKIVPRGYDFLGPGNDVGFNVPRNHNDVVAKDHDIGYGTMLDRGLNPYITYNQWDEDFLRDLMPNDVPTWVAKGLFTGKKWGGRLGLLPTGTSFGNMPRFRKPGPLETKDLAWLHAGDKTDGENTPPGKPTAGPDGDVEMTVDAGGTSKRAREEADRKDGTKTARTEGMNDVTGAGESTVMRVGAQAANSSGGTNGTGETPVDTIPPQLGLFGETHTAILPLRFGVSFVGINNDPTSSLRSRNTLKIRMNAPYNILKDSTFINNTEGASPFYGLGTHQAKAYGSLVESVLRSFETTLVPATAPTATTSGAGVVADANCVPAWRLWFEKIYDSYHTVETQYRITFVSPETTVGNRSRVFEDHDVYTTSSSGNIMPLDVPVMYLNSQFPKVKTTIVEERNNNDGRGWVKQISGVWRPGVWSKNTLNAEDIKGWYATGAEPTPAWNENLVLTARPDEYCTDPVNLNVFVELRYIVQFKDKKETFRYTTPASSAVALNTPGDMLQVPNAPYQWGGQD